MADAPLRRDNHYVPRSYLKRWADGRGKVWAYRCLVSHEAVPLWKPTSTKGVAYHEHLYTRIAASGESDEVERWLDIEFEAPAEDAIYRATTDRRLTQRHWQQLVRFFAAQDVRTPARLMENLLRWNRDLPSFLESTMQEAVRRFEEGDRAPSEEAEGVSPLERFPLRISLEKRPDGGGGFVKGETVVGRGLWLWSIRHTLTRTLSVLEKHKWTILRPPEGMTWFTSDDPVLKVNFKSLADYTFGGGWGSDGTDLLLPLGPHHLLFTQVGRRVPPRGTRMTIESANVVRKLIAEHAHRFVFAAAPDPFVAGARTRIVDAGLLRLETERWNQWHRDQAAAERGLMGLDSAPSESNWSP
jgi:hypothetical protein